MGRYKIKVGEAFEISAVDVKGGSIIDASSNVIQQLELSKSRSRLTTLIATVCIIFLAGAAVVGFLDGSYDELSNTWTALAFPMGAVLGTYFKSK